MTPIPAVIQTAIVRKILLGAMPPESEINTIWNAYKKWWNENHAGHVFDEDKKESYAPRP